MNVVDLGKRNVGPVCAPRHRRLFKQRRSDLQRIAQIPHAATASRSAFFFAWYLREALSAVMRLHCRH